MARSEIGEQGDRQRAVIFDFDGTIADSLPAVIKVFEDLTHRTDRFTPEQIEELRVLSFPELIRALKVPRWKAPVLLFRGRQMLRKHLHDIAVHEGIPEVLEQLRHNNIPIYVLSSNSEENVRSYLAWHKLTHYFTGVYGGASILGKAPRLLKLIGDAKLDAANSWYVGDEMRDVSAARAVKLRSVAVSWGFNSRTALARKGPDALVDEASQLLAVFEELWKK